MRENLYIVLFILVCIFIIWFVRKVKKNLFKLFWAGLILLILVPCAVKFINVNTIPKDVYNVISEIRETVGDEGVIRVNSNDEIEISIEDEWVASSELNILSWLTEGVVIEYGGKEIKIVDSGVISALKILERLKFID